MRRRLLVVLTGVLLLTAGCLGIADGDDGIEDLQHDGEGPVAYFEVTETEDPATYRFDASKSLGDGLSYAWELGDGTESTDPVIEYTYTGEDKVYPVTLTVTDEEDRIDRTVEAVQIGTPSEEAPDIQVDPAVHWIGMQNDLPLDLVGDIEDVTVASALLGEELPDWYPLEDDHEDEAGHDHEDGEEHEHGYQGPTGDWEDSSLLDTGDTHEITFEEQGIYLYSSDPHPSLVGAVIVANTGNAWDEKAAVSIHETTAFAPQILEVQPGTTVTWTNKADTTHDVTLQTHLPIDSFHMPLGPAVAVDFDEPGVHTVFALSQNEAGNLALDHVPILVTPQEPQRGADIMGSGTFDTPDESPDVYKVTLEHEGGAQTTWTWETNFEESAHEDPLEGVRLDVYKGDPEDGDPLYSTTSTDEGFEFDVEPGTYTYVITNEDAFMVEYSLHSHIHLDATPPWIDADHGDHEH